jgi:hypothetical protein
MPHPTNLTELLAFFGYIFAGAGAIASIVIFLGKTLVNQILSRDIEAFKAGMQKDAALEMERLRSELQKAAFEHQVRYSKIYDRRAEVIAHIYKLIAETHNIARTISSDGTRAVFPSSSTDVAELAKKTNELFIYFRAHKLYLDKALAEDIAKFLGNTIRVAGEHWQAQGQSAEQQQMGARITSAVNIEETSEILLGRIENKFQEMLGVTQ